MIDSNDSLALFFEMKNSDRQITSCTGAGAKAKSACQPVVFQETTAGFQQVKLKNF